MDCSCPEVFAHHVDEATGSYRIFNCAWCSGQVRLCSTCDRGNRYCGQVCAALGRRRTLVEAGRRYQRSFRGAVKHARRQMSYKLGCADKVTHQGSLSNGASGILSSESEKVSEPTTSKPEFNNEGNVRCSGCGVFCGPFARQDYIGRCRLVRSKGGRNDHFKRKRIRDPATFPR